MNTELLAQLYQSYTGEAPTSIEPLPGAGSNRKYFRLKGKESLIGVYGTSTEENRAFIYMARHFSQKGLPVPRILAESPDQSAYLQDDLGDTSLFQLIKQGRESGNFSDEETNILKRTIRLLPQIQFEGSKDMDFSYCYPLATFNRRSVLWDLNYFKYCFLKATGLEFQENLLEDDFERMADTLLQIEPQVFMYRDFQSRNVMIREGKPYFIDFREDARDLSITMWLLSSGRQRQTIPIRSVRSFWMSTSMLFAPITRLIRSSSSPPSVTLYCSVLCKS